MWIASWWQDLLCFIGPPLFLVPTFFCLMRWVPLDRLSLLVISFGAVGHHLPGMLRAYGDSELFRRYRTRFILAPIFLVTVSILFSFHRPNSLAVLITIWGFWHAQAQIYGFLRIYDSKAGVTDRSTAIIDRIFCLSWFGGGLVMSSGRMTDFLTIYYRSGGIPIPAEGIRGLQYGVMGLMAASAVAYLYNVLRAIWHRRATSPIKFVTLAISVGFWWFCMVAIRNVVLGVALFEVFHDLQYLAIVWFFNRRRASSGPAAGRFTLLLFQPRYRFVLLYVGLVFLFGAGNLVTRSLERSTVQTILIGLFAASGLLHFYYDGFIWRVREDKTRTALGLSTAKSVPTVGRLRLTLPSWFPHASLWATFCLTLLVFGFASPAADKYGLVVETLPDSAEAHFNYAAELHKQGNLHVAERHARMAVQRHQNSGKVWSILGEIQLSQGRLDAAVLNLTHAVELDPFNAVSHFNLGNAFIRRNEIDAATESYTTAIELDEKHESSAYNNVGMALLESQAYADATVAFRRAVEANPDNVNALTNFANMLARAGEFPDAMRAYEQALTRQPDCAPAYVGLCRMLLSVGKLDEAEAAVNTFIAMCPSNPESHVMLGMLRAEQQDAVAAESALQKALQLDEHHVGAIYGVAQLQLQQGRLDRFLATIDLALDTQQLTPSQRSNLFQMRRRVSPNGSKRKPN